jgi:hypothetical protein
MLQAPIPSKAHAVLPPFEEPKQPILPSFVKTEPTDAMRQGPA